MNYGKYIIFYGDKLFTCNCASKKEARRLAGRYWNLTSKETERLEVVVPQIVKRQS